jgi:predicted secreted Zn-dependent protease
MPLLIVPAGTVPAGVSQRLAGTTLADVVNEVEDADEVGNADFRFDLDYSHANGLITNVDLTMELTVGLPVWENRANRPQPERNEWDRFLRALRVHEDGHVDIFRSEAPTTYERLRRARPTTINRVLATETARIRRLSDAYDHRTDHGRRQQTPHGTTVIQVP